MKTGFLTILLYSAAAFCNVFAQEYDDFNKSKAYYRSLACFSFDFTIRFFDDENSVRAAKTMKGSGTISGKLSKTLFDGKETVAGEGFVIVVYEDNKTVYYSPKKSEKNTGASSIDDVLDQKFLNNYTIKKTQAEADWVKYSLKPKSDKSEYKEIIMVFGTERPVLKEVVYLSGEGYRYKKTVITYSNFIDYPSCGKQLFSESNYLRGTGKNATLLSKYSNYKFINGFDYDAKKDIY